MEYRSVRLLGCIAALIMVLTSAPPVFAKAETLKRQASNALNGPPDMLLQPYTAMSSFVRNMYLRDHFSLTSKITLTPLMLVVYAPSCTFLSIMTSVGRFAEGIFLLPLGAALAGTDEDIGMWEPIHGTNAALIDKAPLYFGAYYCEGFFK